MEELPTEPDGPDAGRAALAAGQWHRARSCFEAELSRQPTPEAWEGLSWATWWLEDVPTCLEAREHAYRGYRDRGDQRGAARMALWLSDDHLEFHGAEAVAAGWSQRAARILADLEPAPEHGWLAVFQAHAALARHDPAEALRLAGQARELGRQFGAVDLEMFGLATEGTALVERGEIAAGMRCLDEAAAAALAGEYEILAPAAWTCCSLISTCERVRDYERSAQWCRQVSEFSRRMQTQFVTGVCRAHYAATLVWRGRWAEAEQELAAATEALSANRPAWLPEAQVRLGVLRLRQGRLDAAEELFRPRPGHPLAVLGLVDVHLERDEPGPAWELLRRWLGRVPTDHPASRVGAVESAVRVELARGEPAVAAEHLAELRAIAAVMPTLPVQAGLRFAEGLVAAAMGDQAAAADWLEEAAERYGHAPAPWELGRCRLELSRIRLAAGRADAAMREAQAAREQFTRLGAGRYAELAAQAYAQARAATGRTAPQHVPLTVRQLEVLHLVADGLSDREIAARLTLSEHTVHRHLANIYARLGCSSRATAVAQASRRGLL